MDGNKSVITIYMAGVDKISSRIFVTLRYRDEDPIVEKPGAVIIANYASVTIISNQRKTCTY